MFAQAPWGPQGSTGATSSRAVSREHGAEEDRPRAHQLTHSANRAGRPPAARRSQCPMPGRNGSTAPTPVAPWGSGHSAQTHTPGGRKSASLAHRCLLGARGARHTPRAQGTFANTYRYVLHFQEGKTEHLWGKAKSSLTSTEYVGKQKIIKLKR